MRIANCHAESDFGTLGLFFDPSLETRPSQKEGDIGEWRRQIRRVIKDGFDSSTVVFNDGTHYFGLAGAAPKNDL